MGSQKGKCFVWGEMLDYNRAPAKQLQPAVEYEHRVGLCPYTSGGIGQDKPPH